MLQYSMGINSLTIEVEQFFVSPMWVASHYGVSLVQVHRAIAAKRLTAARIVGGKRNAWVLDRRLLPVEFPR